MKIQPGTLLSKINSPEDLKKLSRVELHKVCDELRQYIIDVVSVHGGHFGASLGVVEFLWLCIMFSIPLTISWFGM
jgi:1-deoxy-D-xylulose-5-phosphate synthase